MTALRGRLRRIEAAIRHRAKPDPKNDDRIVEHAMALVCEQDREICDGIALGRVGAGRDLTRREWRAIEAYNEAIEVEAIRAGYTSIDEFCRSYLQGSDVHLGSCEAVRIPKNANETLVPSALGERTSATVEEHFANDSR